MTTVEVDIGLLARLVAVARNQSMIERGYEPLPTRGVSHAERRDLLRKIAAARSGLTLP